MRQILRRALYPRNFGRVLTGLFIAAALLATGGHSRPLPAAASNAYLPPQILSIRLEQPDTAYLTFRETNDVGADVTSAGLRYSFVVQPHPGHGYIYSPDVPAAGNGRTHTVTISGLQSGVLWCFVGAAGVGDNADPSALWAHIWDGTSGIESGSSDEICSDMSQAGTAESPLPCGVSGIKVTDANSPIRSYDYTYYCDGSFSFHVTSLFDTRPLSSDPSDANNHRAFEKLQDGNTQIIVNWSCPTDPWGVADTQTCTQRGDPSVQNPLSSFAVQNGPLPLSVRFLNDEDRQEIADGLRQALAAPDGTNRPLTTLSAGTAPAAGSTAGGGSATSGGSTSSAALPKAPAAPTNYTGARDNGLGLTIILSWNAATGADYYYLTAYSHDGGNPVALHDPAPKLDKSTTQFTVGSGDNAANIQGGVDFKLQACNAGGCSPTLTVTVK
jgi:hypothetical protein